MSADAENRLHMHGNRISVMESEVRAHMKSDDERYSRIDSGINKIELALTTFIDKMDRSIERVHSVIDERVGGLSQDIANVESIARAEAKISMALAQDAHDKIAGVKADVDSTGSSLKIWVLGATVAALLSLLGILVEHFVFREAPRAEKVTGR
jgi:hypothetical protein